MTELEKKIYKAFLIKKPEFDKAFNSLDYLVDLQSDFIDFPFVMDSGVFNYVRYDIATAEPIKIKYPVYINDDLDSEWRNLYLNWN